MKKTILAATMVVIVFAAPSFALIEPMVDLWNNAAYHSTNGERANFNSFSLMSQGKFGVRVLSDSAPGVALEPYVAYYGVASQDENYWNNQLALGVGVRVFPFLNYQAAGWADEWLRDVKFYAETLSLSILNDPAEAAAAKVKTADNRFGADFWHEWNLKDIDPKAPWAEAWGNISYYTTDFQTFDFNTYLFYLQTKYGIHLGNGVRPYLASYLTYSGLPQSWLNNWYYGVGLRIEPFREQANPPEILRKFRMFIEVLGIAWLQENDTPPRPNSELRFGMETTFGR